MRKWKMILLVALLVCTGTVAICTYIYRIERPLDPKACLGQPEADIISRLGTPTSRSPGSFGMPPARLLAGHTHIETLAWKCASGTLYVSTSDESGQRICFDADWLPAGAVY